MLTHRYERIFEYSFVRYISNIRFSPAIDYVSIEFHVSKGIGGVTGGNFIVFCFSTDIYTSSAFGES